MEGRVIQLLSKKIHSDYDHLMSYVERIHGLNGGTACALFVIQNNHVAAEYYSGKHSIDGSARKTGADSQFNVASVRKSYLGLAAAWALNNRSISSFDDPLSKYLQLNEQDNEAIAGVTIRNLLTHTHGLKEENGQIMRDYIPGTDWHYNNVGVGLLQTLISQALGMPYADFLKENIFIPLGWSETGWRNYNSELLVPLVSEQGYCTRIRPTTDGSEGNLFVSARELAYWGYLHMNLGKMNGKSIVPESVIRTAIAIQSPSNLPKDLPINGCFWFIKNGESSQCFIGKDVPNHSFEIVGLYGPLVLVVPEFNLVAVRMSNQERGNYADDKGSYIDYLKEFSDLAVATAARINKVVAD